MIQPISLGWMAGIIDLKGKFVFKENKMRKTKQTIIYVETRHVEVVKKLSELTGVSPETRKQAKLKDWMRRGCTEHCPEPHIHVSDEREIPEIARWTITGAALAVILHNLLPFLVMTSKNYEGIKDKILEDTPLTGQGSARVVWSIRRLALLGWDLPTEYEGVMDDQPVS